MVNQNVMHNPQGLFTEFEFLEIMKILSKYCKELVHKSFHNSLITTDRQTEIKKYLPTNLIFENNPKVRFMHNYLKICMQNILEKTGFRKKDNLKYF